MSDYRGVLSSVVSRMKVAERVALRYFAASDPIISWLKTAGNVRFQAVFFTGLPGAGKSQVKTKKYLQHTGFKDIDPDEIKKLHPNYNPTNLKGTYHVHDWSIAEADRQLSEVLPTGDPFILDGTGTNVNKLLPKMRMAKAAGYRVFLVYVYVPIEISVFRNRQRGAQPGGRWVPESIILDKAKTQDKAFDQLKAGADKYKVVLNFEAPELAIAKKDLALYPAPAAELPPRPGTPGYGENL
jgi:predicted ABC-type ATPase